VKIENANQKSTAVAAILASGQREVEILEEQYFAEAYELGMVSADEIAEFGREMSAATAASRVGEMTEEERGYTAGWFGAIQKDVDRALEGDYADKAAAGKALRTAATKKLFRVAAYAGAAHKVLFKGFKEEMILQRVNLAAKAVVVEALFTAFPEADVIETSCFGCPGAVDGNPYTPSTVPSPGEFECLTKCRHWIMYRKKLIQS